MIEKAQNNNKKLLLTSSTRKKASMIENNNLIEKHEIIWPLEGKTAYESTVENCLRAALKFL